MKSILSCIFLLSCACAMNAQNVDFYQGSWEDLHKMAKAQDKMILVDAYADWCVPCKEMDRVMFNNNAEVADLINSNFIAYKIDCERNFGLDFTRKFKIAGYPSLLFFNTDGQLIDRQLGYDSKQSNFIEGIDKVVKMDKSDTYGYDATKINMPWPDFYKMAYRNANDSTWKFPKDADVSGFLSQQEDLFAEISWAVMSRFQLDKNYTQYFKDNYSAYQKLYKKEASNKMQNVLFADVNTAAKTNDSEKFKHTLSQVNTYFPGDPENFGLYIQQYFYEATEDWAAYADMMTKMIRNKELEVGLDQINSVAWTLYESCDDAAILEIAKSWFQPYLANMNEYFAMDTYAALLYKLGEYDNAKIWANQAITVGKTNNLDVKETEQLLEKINAESK